MQSMFADYYKEELGWDCIQNEYGFIFYFLNSSAPECYISGLYIKPEYRKTIEAKKLFSSVVDIARENNCEFITAQIACGPNREEKATKIMRCYLAMGFKVVNANGSQILLKYDLKASDE